MKNEYEQKIDELYTEVGKLSTQLSWLKKNLASNQSREERMDLVEWQRPELPILIQANLLSLNRSSLYYNPIPPSLEEIRLKHRIDEHYTQYPFLGYRKMAATWNKYCELFHTLTILKKMS